MPPLPARPERAFRLSAVVGVALIAALPSSAGGQVVRPDPGAVLIGRTPDRMFGMMGKRILAPKGTEIGRVVDLVVDMQGRPRAAVVDVGGFLGIGSRRIALAWERLAFRGEDDAPRIETDVPPERISAAPEYRPGEAASVFDPDEEG